MLARLTEEEEEIQTQKELIGEKTKVSGDWPLQVR